MNVHNPISMKTVVNVYVLRCECVECFLQINSYKRYDATIVIVVKDTTHSVQINISNLFVIYCVSTLTHYCKEKEEVPLFKSGIVGKKEEEKEEVSICNTFHI